MSVINVAALAVLDPPTMAKAPDGKLPPATTHVQVDVPVYAGKQLQDEVTMRWTGHDAAASTSDDLPVNAGNLSRALHFDVEDEFIRANDGYIVTVTYEVARNGVTVGESSPLKIAVGDALPEPGDLAPPQVQGLVAGVLNLETVDAVQGALMTVAPYSGMAQWDAVAVSSVEGTFEQSRIIDKGDVGQPVPVQVPKATLSESSGTTIHVYTTVVHEGKVRQSASIPVLLLEAVGTLAAPRVPAAENGDLDPAKVQLAVQAVVDRYSAIAQGDIITFSWNNASSPIDSPHPHTVTVSDTSKAEYVFEVAKEAVTNNVDGLARLSYTVTRGAADPKASASLDLWIGESFQEPATLDLSNKNVILSDKPPKVAPTECLLTRVAKFGTAPYTYASSNKRVATVDASGTVTALRDGMSQITATDSNGASRSYTVTINGIKVLAFLAGSTNYAGAGKSAQAMGMRVPTKDEMQRFWDLYSPSSGPVASYLGWLPYPFWTGTDMGAGTVWIYDLNGTSARNNADGADMTTFQQAVGIAP